MDDFKKQFEQGKIARSQGIIINKPESIANPQKNRIEDMLKRVGENAEPLMPVFEPKPERVVETPVKVERQSSGLVGKFFKILGVIVLSLMILALIAWGGYKLLGSSRFSFASLHIFGSKEMTVDEVIQAVGKLVDLPAGEEPTVATVTDLKPLANSAFFKDALIGDKVLIYSKSGKAILYRPSQNKIIVVGPLTKQ